MESEYVTVKEAAEICHCSKYSVYSWIRDGHLTAVPLSECGISAPHFNSRYLLVRAEVLALPAAMPLEQRQGTWYSLEAAAAYLGLSVSAVKKILVNGHLRSVRWSEIPIEQRKYEKQVLTTYIEEADLERFAASDYAEVTRQSVFTVSAFDLGYTTALVDGEGCIYLAAQQYKERRYYHPAVSITNTHFGVLEWMRDTYGGVLSPARQLCARHKPRRDWKIMSGGAYTLLKLLAPQLKIKHRQAALVISYYESILNRHRYHPMSQEEQQWRDSVAAHLHELNRKGPPSTTE